MMPDDHPAAPKSVVLIVVYLSLLLDNILLTVVVPIVPDYLVVVETSFKSRFHVKLNESLQGVEKELMEENGRVGFLLSSKAFVQLLVNPIIGFSARYVGHTLPLFIGTVNLLSSSLLFAFGEGYWSLFLARSFQGLASSCIGISGMSLVAEHYTSEGPRSRVMGFVLGSVALGVLLGYPFGGFLYDFMGKTAPFTGIAALTIVDIGVQLVFLDLTLPPTVNSESAKLKDLISDKMVMLTAGAIGISTSAMSVLEPCLPLWLMTKIKPEKWELGTVFIPDSVGYLLGTNLFGSVSYTLGRWRVALAAMILVAVSCLLVPTATSLTGLIGPHFGLGLGIGIVDSALVPLLASLVDNRHSAGYAVVYALQQTSVSLAYALGPMIGGEMVHLIGFPALMRCIGLMNLLYCPFIALLNTNKVKEPVCTQQVVNYQATQHYQRFNNGEDSD